MWNPETWTRLQGNSTGSRRAQRSAALKQAGGAGADTAPLEPRRPLFATVPRQVDSSLTCHTRRC